MTADKVADNLVLIKQLEENELQAPGGVATPVVYSQLLTMYLLQNDLINAKFLWKRVPQTLKAACPEIGHIWAVGQHMWNRNFPGIYKAIDDVEWSENVKELMEKLKDATRLRAIALVSHAYMSLSGDDFSSFVGLPVEQATDLAASQGWGTDATTRMILPKRPEKSLDTTMASEKHLSRMADFVSFLET